MKNYEKYITALLIQLNQKGIEVNYEKYMRYSEKYGTMQTECCLKFWHKRIDEFKKDKNENYKVYYWCDEKPFKGAKKYANIIKYLQVCLEKTKESED